jgi:Domain of unknown function DUF83.
MHRVHKLITCLYFQNEGYDESKHGGHAVESLLYETLKEYGFKPQQEIVYNQIIAHPDFIREAEEYIEVIEVKNTCSMSYTHVLQLSMYVALLHKLYGKPVVPYLIYTKFRIVLGSNPTPPEWFHKFAFDYVFLPITSGEEYISYAELKVKANKKSPGPYCKYCSAESCEFKKAFAADKGAKDL